MNETHTTHELRSFGLSVGGIFLLIGLWPFLRRGLDVRLWAIAVGAALIVPAAMVPSILGRPYRLWTLFAHVLGWINTRVILTIMFYAVFTPVACFMRLFGADPLERALRSNTDTYRVVRQSRGASHMKHQF